MHTAKFHNVVKWMYFVVITLCQYCRFIDGTVYNACLHNCLL